MSDKWLDNKTRAQFMQELTTCWQMIEQLGDDNKRLRGLLREAPKHAMTENLRRRVREALGE